MKLDATDNLLKLIETLAPYFFGGSGIFAVGLKYFVDRESKKIASADKKAARAIANTDKVMTKVAELEKTCDNQKNALQAIISQCDSADALGQTFETSEITPKQLIFLKTLIDKIRYYAEDVLEDGIFRNRRR